MLYCIVFYIMVDEIKPHIIGTTELLANNYITDMLNWDWKVM